MSSRSTNLYRAEQVRALDRFAIDVVGVAGYQLMKRAGEAAFDLLQAQWPQTRALSVYCGGGNNGGDGYVIASLARQQSYSVKVYALSDPARLNGDAQTAYQDWLAAGGEVLPFTGQAPEGLIVDAMLGSGLDREVEGNYLTAIEGINQSRLPVLAVDIPSGLNADTGMPLGAAIRADHTISFIGQKRGLFTGSGRQYTGHIHYHDLDVASRVFDSQHAEADLFAWSGLSAALEPRPLDAHKGHFGHVLLVGGETGYTGAIRMAGEAGLRSGAGLVSIATRPAHAGLINLPRPELMCHGVSSGDGLRDLVEQANVIGIGPGLGQSSWAQQMLDAVLESRRPLVVDADGLNLLAQEPMHYDHWVLTPHPGEASRLLGVSIAEVQVDRFAAAQAIQSRFGGVVVLKGSGTLVVDGGGPVGVCADGNPGMASGGMGDVLTGIICAWLAQGYSLVQATRMGVALHAAAADKVAKSGMRGMLATDLFVPIRELVNPVS